MELRYDPAEESGFLKMIPGLRILQEQPGLACADISMPPCHAGSEAGWHTKRPSVT
ncbi:MAG: hypothetical protein PHI24_06165 [Desulfitobacteriaceae bacterium]|nr:hypothetical protein [Desulfitobacteriaceae bacterium]